MGKLIVAFRKFANATNNMTLSVNVQPHAYQAQEPQILPNVSSGWNDACIPVKLLQNVVFLIRMRFVKRINISCDTEKPSYSSVTGLNISRDTDKPRYSSVTTPNIKLITLFQYYKNKYRPAYRQTHYASVTRPNIS